MSKFLQIFDINTYQNYWYSVRYSDYTLQFVSSGAVGVEFELTPTGVLKFENGQNVIATDDYGKKKIGPILLQWNPRAIYCYDTFETTGDYHYAGAWTGGSDASATSEVADYVGGFSIFDGGVRTVFDGA